MRELKKILYKSIFLFIFILLFGDTSLAYELEAEHFDILHEDYSIDGLEEAERYADFIKEDEKYIESLDRDELKREIARLDEHVYEANTSFKRTEKGVLLYSPEAVGNIVVCDIASKNRRRLLEAREKGKKFKYDRRVVHYPKKNVRVKLVDTIDKEVLEVVYKETEKLLNSIELPRSMLENTIVSLSPFKMRGLKAFTELYGAEKEGVTIVLGIDGRFYNKDGPAFREEVKSVLLHELGHNFHLENTRNYKEHYDLNNPYWKEYREYYPEYYLDFSYSDKRTRTNWEKDIRENMAEDFRIVYSDRLGQASFEAGPKKTKAAYNKDIENFLDKHESRGIGSEFVCTRHSSIRAGDINYTLYDYEARDIENKDGLEIKLHSKEGMVCKDAYMGVWRDGKKERSDRIPIKNKEDSYLKIPKNSDINTVIKYIKVRDKYIPLWRLNIK